MIIADYFGNWGLDLFILNLFFHMLWILHSWLFNHMFRFCC